MMVDDPIACSDVYQKSAGSEEDPSPHSYYRPFQVTHQSSENHG